MGNNVYLWQIHIDVWQNQYNIVKLKKKGKTCSMKDMFKRIKMLSSKCTKIVAKDTV